MIVSRSASETARIGLIERLFILFVLFLSTSAVFPILLDANSEGFDAADSFPILRRTWIVVYILALPLILKYRREILISAKQNWLLVSLTLLAVASISWSDAPSLSMRRSVALVCTTAFGFYMGSRCSVKELIRMTGTIFAIIGLLSLIWSLWYPELGIDYLRSEAWRGVFLTKNELGRAMAYGFAAWLVISLDRSWYAGLSMIFLFLSSLLVVMSDSKTSQTAIVVIVLLVAAVQLYRRSDAGVLGITTMVGTGLGVLAVSWATRNADAILEDLGRDSTANGRTVLWDLAWQKLQERLILGHGYNAFWQPDGEARYIWNRMVWQAPHAHNGWLDLGLDLGFAGISLFTVVVLVTTTRSILLTKRDGAITLELFYPVLLFLTILTNMSESTILSRTSIYWLLFVAVSVQVNNQWVQAAAKPRKSLREYGFEEDVASRQGLPKLESSEI